MAWLAISQRGISEPYFVPSGLAVNQHIYLGDRWQFCILARLSIISLGEYGYVNKEVNPANVPKARPIEHF
ncbi:hypothetical protein BpHYR1_010933 [Brachionus plicatilis]|uniref:Uncharacterized protein n=1 Tax=Brachionus plicatilis TaxID=10195 RepID=A0A3M7QVH3_BRAPC|nr:hypothetical protein BpHYR1_010933 [Brachionus plicatilis]